MKHARREKRGQRNAMREMRMAVKRPALRAKRNARNKRYSLGPIQLSLFCLLWYSVVLASWYIHLIVQHLYLGISFLPKLPFPISQILLHFCGRQWYIYLIDFKTVFFPEIKPKNGLVIFDYFLPLSRVRTRGENFPGSVASRVRTREGM